jgi:IS1 family transposase
MDFCGEKTLPRKDEYEDEGTWIWISMAANCRLVLSHIIGERSQKIADQLVANTAKKLRSMPRGRPRSPELIVDELLKYAQVIKMRVNGRLNKVVKRIIFGENIDPKMISTSYIERQNLTCRQDNNRISRKTIGFSKKTMELDSQMTLYFANFNFCRRHRALKYRNDKGITKFNCPAKQAGLIDHVWSLKELLTFPYHKIQTY